MSHSTDPTRHDGKPSSSGSEHFAEVRDSDPYLPGLRFEQRGVIAMGGMGSIVNAYDPLLDRHVALKVLHATLAGRTGEIENFTREARITSQLEHPNIVPVHELHCDQSAEWACFAMKLVEGQALSQLYAMLGDGPLHDRDLHRLLTILLRVCDAVSFAHSRNVLHLDLKPDNIMVGSHGQVYVMDWGIAVRCARDEAGLLKPLEAYPGVRGTLAYMPPEQLTVGLSEVDQRSDVYALGAMLYELLTGRTPFQPLGCAEDLLRLSEHIVIDPMFVSMARKPPPGLVSIAMRALARERSARYPSVDAFRSELEEVLRGGGWFRIREFTENTVIVREGEPGEEAYILTEGECDVYKESGSERVHLRRMQAGAVFGEVAVLTGAKRSATVIAACKVRTLVVTRDALEHELEARGWLGAFIRALAERFREADDERLRLRRALHDSGE